MPIIAVTSSSPGEGKTAVAVAIARHFAYAGRPTQLVRIEGDQGHASEDAAFFASLTFAPGSAGVPVEAGAVKDPGEDGVVVAECAPEQAASLKGAHVVLVARGTAPASLPEGISPAALVVTAASPGMAIRPLEGIPLVAVPEDRTLAGFSVDEARTLLNAEVLVEGDPGQATCDHLVIAPISSDAGQPYFRRFASKAVVVRFDKTDQHLAALRGDADLLILTGGRRPSDYVFDAAGSQGVPVLLSRTDTENTIMALEDIFERTRFHGERKLERMANLLEGSGLFEALE